MMRFGLLRVIEGCCGLLRIFAGYWAMHVAYWAAVTTLGCGSPELYPPGVTDIRNPPPPSL